MASALRSTLLLLIAGAAVACRDPTQITLEISTDLACDALEATSITVGSLGELEGSPPAAVTSACSPDGRIGALVAVPADEGSADVAFRVVSSVEAPIDACVAPDYGPACIVARRSLRYLPHEALLVPIVMRKACQGVLCPVDQTCVNGLCASAALDPGLCSGDGCGEEDLEPKIQGAGGGGGDAGAGGEGGAGEGGTGDGGEGGSGGQPLLGWSNTYGSTDHDYGLGLAVDGSGRFALGGSFVGNVSFGDPTLSATARDAFLASYNADGSHRWSKDFGGGGDDAVRDVTASPSGEVTITGSFFELFNIGLGDHVANENDDVFAARFALDGTPLWSVAFGSTASDDAGRSVAVDSSGNNYVGGSYHDAMAIDAVNLLSEGNADGFLVALAPGGDGMWGRSFGADADDQVNAVAVRGSNVYVAGKFREIANLGGSDLTSAGGDDVFVASYTTAGVHRWSLRFGGTLDDEANALAVDASENVTVTGSFRSTVALGTPPSLVSAGGNDAFIASFESDGDFRWKRSIGSAADGERGEAITVDSLGAVYVTGNFRNTVNAGGAALTSAGDGDAFVACYTPAGVHRWSGRFGGSTPDEAGGLAVPSENTFAATGFFSGSVDFGLGSKTSAGGNDVFLVKLEAGGDGNPFTP